MLSPPYAAASRNDRPTISDADLQEALPPGARLDEFEIVRVLGVGGFGIVYLATDPLLQRQVAIKEYIPLTLARRASGGGVEVRSDAGAETFSIGLESFYNEGRLLARFDHPSLVKAFRFWKAQGTAYMAMQYYPGLTLKEARRRMGTAPDERWLRAFLDGLLGALETLHRQGVFHRDIAPDNILLLPDGQPVILDFGSARRVIGDRTQSLTALLKPNYSPVEQYADEAGLRQGAHTDFYALGGTVYFMLTGRDPVPAIMRAVRDTFPLLRQTIVDVDRRVSRNFLAVIDWMLAVAPDDRPRNVDAIRLALDGKFEPPAPSERHGVVIAEAGVADDPSRASARTEQVPAKAPLPMQGEPDPTTPLRAADSESSRSEANTSPSPTKIDSREPSMGANRRRADATLDAPSPRAGAGVAEAVPVAPRRRAGWTGLFASLGVLALVGWGAWATMDSIPDARPTPAAPAAAPSSVAVPATGPAPAVAAAPSPKAAPASLGLSPNESIVPSAPAGAARQTSARPESPIEATTPALASISTDADGVASAGRTPAKASVQSGAQPTARDGAASGRKADAAPAPPAGHPSIARAAPGAEPVLQSQAGGLGTAPAALCVNENVFARATCLARACDTAQARSHPQCVEARRLAEQRQRRMEQ